MATAVATEDAKQAYRDLSAYAVEAHVSDGDWTVDFRLKEKGLKGGGPHYVVDGETGAIKTKRYDQ